MHVHLTTVAFLLLGTASFLQRPSELAPPSQLVAQGLPGFRLAVNADFVPELAPVTRETALAADFNGDHRDDWALVVVNESTREYRIYYVLNLPAGPQYDRLLAKQFPEASVSAGVIRNAIFLKPPGVPGIAQRKYARILGDDIVLDASENSTPAIRRDAAARTREYTSVPALEVWTGPARVDATDLRHFPDEGIAYCSTAWYYRTSGILAHFSACD